MHYFKDFQFWLELTEVIGFGGFAHKASGGMHGSVTVVRGAEVQACADPEARTPIGASGNFLHYS